MEILFLLLHLLKIDLEKTRLVPIIDAQGRPDRGWDKRQNRWIVNKEVQKRCTVNLKSRDKISTSNVIKAVFSRK